jgi:hypothetical protein
VGKDTNENILIKLLDALNLDGFLDYNFKGLDPVKKPHRLTTQNIPHCTRVRLRKVQKQYGWNDCDVITNLKIPEHKKLRYLSHNPIYYKYVYTYYVNHKTDLFYEYNHISDEDIIKPVDNPVLFATLLL